MTLPTFICIGAQRAGTTWLYEMLAQHPDIYLPAVKELHFFDEKPDFSDYQGLGNPGRRFYYDLNSPAHWRWYQKQFKRGADVKARGEITPFYATLSAQRVAFIAEKLPELKIIYIIRNPVQRAWSGFRLFWFLETKHRECHLDADIIEKTIMYPAKLIHGNYQRNINTYEKTFTHNKILYLFYDDIITEPLGFLEKVYSFLDVHSRPINTTNMMKRVNNAPNIEMPESVFRALSEYYADQFVFIQTRFNRILEY